MTIGSETSFWLGGETSFLNMKRGRSVFLKYGLGAKRLFEIWFGCETSFWNMVWVRNVFLNYEDGGETSFLFMGRGWNLFPKYELGRNVSLKMVRTDYGAKRLCTGLSTCRINYLSEFRPVGISTCRNIDLSEYRPVGPRKTKKLRKGEMALFGHHS